MRKVPGQYVGNGTHVKLAPGKYSQFGDKFRILADDLLNGFLHLCGVVAIEFCLIEK